MATATSLTSQSKLQAVRQFNRFYTRQIGLLQEGLLHSPFSLTEVRVMYELAHRQHPTATEICDALQLDRGYLSRMLRSFVKAGLVEKIPSASDARENLLRLTRRGQTEFSRLDVLSNQQVSAMLDRLGRPQQARLIAAMQAIEELLAGQQKPAQHSGTIILRGHQPGDMGWVVHRHGVLYAQEYGWDERFEALVAEIAAHFVQHLDPKRERCWIAEKDGETVGSVFLVKKSKTTAKLRLLLVEPNARGLGLGKRLVGECIRFARQAGYKKITLWTQSILGAARHVYKEAGFRIVKREKNDSFDAVLVAETWELEL
jgi:DNA-binding MarR family transcriptional regulator/N-acetylglutamate synthase-like GNAT family acetyltransferase